MKSKVSLIIPSYNSPEEDIKNLKTSLLEQKMKDFEVVVVDDSSDFDFYDLLDSGFFKLKVVRKQSNSGPGDSRNIGAQVAESSYIFFTDTDCKLNRNTLQEFLDSIEEENIVTGNTVTETETLFGKLVAFLGFPGGGNIGFHRVWKVDEKGFTNSFSSCNVGMKAEVFRSLEGFDTSSPVPGGEDTILASKALKEGWKIRYNPNQIIYHKERSGFLSFIKWQVVRGRGNYYIRLKVPAVSGYLKLRVWSFFNSLKKSGFWAPVVSALIVLSVLLQSYGFYCEKRKIGNSGRQFNAQI